MLHLAIVAVLLLHGVGHAIGFWMPVPWWFAAVWLLPGIGFLVGAWGLWQQAAWSSNVLLVSAAGSLVLLAVPTGAWRHAPYLSALAFDLLVMVGLALPWTRRLALGH